MVARGVMTKDEFGFWGRLDAEALRADGAATVVVDFDDGALAPDEGPPRTTWDGTQDGTFFFFGGVPGLLGFHLEFAVKFMLVAMATQVGDVRIGLGEIGDVFAGEKGGEPVLPELVFPFDFAFGLRRGGVAEGDAVEVEGLAELGQGVGGVGEEEGMEVHVEFQRQAVFEEGGGEEVVIGQEVFVLVEFGAGEEAAAIVEHVEHGEESFAGREPAVGRGIELPEFADLGALPAADGGGGLALGFGMGELIFAGPTADLSAVHFEIAEAQDFAGGEAVVGGRGGSQTFAQEREDFGWPLRSMVAAGVAREPKGFLMVSASAQIIGVEFVETTAGEFEFGGRSVGVELLRAEAGQDVTDQRHGETMGKLLVFFMGRSLAEAKPVVVRKVDFSLWN